MLFSIMDSPELLQRLIQLQALLFATYLYCVLVVRPLSPGLPRLLASLPACVVFTLSPYFVKDSAVLSSGIGLTTMWVATFKLLAYSGGRGALSHPRLRTNLQWAALLVLPFFPAKSGRKPAQGSTTKAIMGLLVELSVWLGLTALLVTVDMSPLARHLVYAVHFWMFISLCLHAAMPLGRQLVPDIPLQPAMDAPYASVTIREFWGRRYNQIVSVTLLETVYKPIVEGRLVAQKAVEATEGAAAKSSFQEGRVSLAPVVVGGNLTVRAGPLRADGKNTQSPRVKAPLVVALAGLFASFLVSGVMHEICLWFSCGGKLDGSFRMTAFFMLQPLLILAQDGVVVAAKWLVPERLTSTPKVASVGRVMLRLSTWVLLLLSGELFWGSVESCGADLRGLQEVDSAMLWLLAQARAAGLPA